MLYLGNGIFYDNYLCHHGIKGQRWGVKNGPPYPLSYTTKRDAGLGKRQGMSKFISDVDNQYEESYLYRHNGKDRFMTPVDALQIMEESSPDYISIPGRELGGNHSWDDSDFNINDMNEAGQSNNCAKCASAAMLRRRGYDVQPGRSAFGALTEAPEYWWDDAEKHNNLSMNDAYDILNEMPNGAAGTISGQRDDGGGHVLNWEKTEHGVKFMDFQPKNGITKTDINSVFDNENFNKEKDCTIYRLDTATPNWDHMAEDGVIRINKDGHSAIYGRKQDNFYQDISFDTIPIAGTSQLSTRTTFKNVFTNWEHSLVNKKNGEQARGYDAI